LVPTRPPANRSGRRHGRRIVVVLAAYVAVLTPTLFLVAGPDASALPLPFSGQAIFYPASNPEESAAKSGVAWAQLTAPDLMQVGLAEDGILSLPSFELNLYLGTDTGVVLRSHVVRTNAGGVANSVQTFANGRWSDQRAGRVNLPRAGVVEVEVPSKDLDDPTAVAWLEARRDGLASVPTDPFGLADLLSARPGSPPRSAVRGWLGTPGTFSEAPLLERGPALEVTPDAVVVRYSGPPDVPRVASEDVQAVVDTVTIRTDPIADPDAVLALVADRSGGTISFGGANLDVTRSGIDEEPTLTVSRAELAKALGFDLGGSMTVGMRRTFTLGSGSTIAAAAIDVPFDPSAITDYPPGVEPPAEGAAPPGSAPGTTAVDPTTSTTTAGEARAEQRTQAIRFLAFGGPVLLVILSAVAWQWFRSSPLWDEYSPEARRRNRRAKSDDYDPYRLD